MKEDTFKTITTTSNGEFRSKGSKFLATLVPTKSTDPIRNMQSNLRKQHPKANHVCYGYRIGLPDTEERAQDDGEPSGSAGLPILNQLKSAELVNATIFVVRYFGGTKLGVSGLIQAYKAAAEDAISNTTIKKDHIFSTLELLFPIGKMGPIMNYLGQSQFVQTDSVFEETVQIQLQIRRSMLFQNLRTLQSQLLGYKIEEIIGDFDNEGVKISVLDDKYGIL